MALNHYSDYTYQHVDDAFKTH